MQINEPRQQLDHMLRETRLHLISFSHLADTKANILLSISSVLLSISLTQVTDPRFTGAVLVLVGFLLAVVVRAVARPASRRRADRVRRRLMTSVAAVADERILAPVERVLADHRVTREALRRVDV